MNQWIDTLPGPRLKQLVTEHGDMLRELYGTKDAYFGVWMHSLNHIVRRTTGLSFDDLEDWMYWDAYEGDMSPKEAATQMLADNGWDIS